MVPPSSSPRRTLLFRVTILTIVVFGSLAAAIAWQWRSRLRDEVLRREAEAIHAVAVMLVDRGETRLAEFGAEFAVDDLFAAVLESSTLRGVLAVQLFDGHGRLRKASTVPPEDAEASKWWPDDLAIPRARFVREGMLEMAAPLAALEAMRTGANARVPMLDIAVPLTSRSNTTMLRVARYWVDGTTVANELSRIDRGLALQGLAVVAVAGVLAWLLARLGEVNRRLAEQSADLLRANQELDFAAKTVALGAISAHLIHGLKNPLAGIEGFVFETVIGDPDGTRGDACRQAIETTRRLRALVSEVSTVLRDETEGEADYPVPLTEIVEAARARGQPAAEKAGVLLGAKAAPDAAVTARVANLAGLVLANLITNAIEASPRGGGVLIEARGEQEHVAFLVRDQGPGIPAEVQTDLFRPVRSSKRGGGGVGLAISLRLAKHAGGNLELVRSDARGTEFRLTVPAKVPAA